MEEVFSYIDHSYEDKDLIFTDEHTYDMIIYLNKISFFMWTIIR